MLIEQGIPLPEEVHPSGLYWAYCIVAAFVVKAVISLFIAANRYKNEIEKRHGQLDLFPKDKEQITYWRIYGNCWNGVTPHSRHFDLWLPFLIGLSELIAYPVLMKAGQFSAIGIWLAIRAGAGWRGWQQERTSYPRFVFGAILTLAISYFLTNYVTIGKSDSWGVHHIF
ncbi:MAG: hypothetical protein WCC04_13680 [Terriglobales bacterium]